MIERTIGPEGGDDRLSHNFDLVVEVPDRPDAVRVGFTVAARRGSVRLFFHDVHTHDGLNSRENRAKIRRLA